MRSVKLAGLSCALVVVAAGSAGLPVFGEAAFTEEALTRGLDFTMTPPYPQAQGEFGQGNAFVDLDSDGDADVVIIGGTDGKVGIFENIGGGFFVDHTQTSGIPVMVEHQALAASDYDADGLIDLYITQAYNHTNYLVRNNGNFTFTDVSLSSGTNNGPQHSAGPNWGDYNDDGWVDLYVSNYTSTGHNALYRNNGNGTFTNLGTALGVNSIGSLSFQAVWSDFDRDGDADLYLSNDRAPLGWPENVLWRNDDGTFVDVSAGSGADVAIYSMGIAAGDIDDNGYPDYYVTNLNNVDGSGQSIEYDGYNPLLLNQGNGTFVDSAAAWGVDNYLTSWGSLFFDWDNDTYLDLYVNNQFTPNTFFHCAGTLPCTEKALALGIGAAIDPVYDFDEDFPTITSFNASVADVDDDGDLDLLVTNLGYRAELFINQEGQTRNWVRYDIVGEHPNLFAVGASVDTTAGGKTQFFENYAGGNNYLGQNELVIHVGLGSATVVDQAVFQWPSDGPTRTLTGLPANTKWKVYPPSRLCDDDGDGVDYDDFVAFSGCYMAGFSQGCEMMDFDGDSNISAGDLDSCFVSAPSDCNGNGTEDLAEIMLDLGLDTDQNNEIDCCDPGPATEPNPVGSTLLVDKNGSDQPVLSWTAPATDGSHGPATSYDVFRSTTVPPATSSFSWLTNVTPTTHIDAVAAPAVAYYLVGARNGCGSSGEEPF